ncbi:MAG: carbamoyltransferase HypF [Lachnospiraceae bacterium]|nr:carbamoyltransferase HypF [Lachnospiraceae bacterium]
MSGSFKRLCVTGAVQGVGFRPFVKALADEYHLTGTVRNSGGIVRILITKGNPEDIAAFVRGLKERAPKGAVVLAVTEEAPHSGNAEDGPADGFAIAESDGGKTGQFPVFTPDLAVCQDCLAEMRDEKNRRFRYPLISCAQCGPRYSILESLPYDRERTTMRPFSLCPACEGEYRTGRRRHAQTISCHSCGPQLVWRGIPTDPDPVSCAVRVLRTGGIIGLKGIGGYQLLADPKNGEAVRRLRTMKGRESKPFAVLFGSVDEVRRYCAVSPFEASVLESAARPIVLLAPLAASGRKHEWSGEVCDQAAFIGAFLPAFGAQQMLVDACGPLIATSANLSGAPMMISDEAFAGHFLCDEPKDPFRADGALVHDRRILAPLDDSVCFADDCSDGGTEESGGRLRFVRRARGYVPLPVILPEGGQNVFVRSGDLIAFGGDLKASFALARGDRIILSQPFGDLDNRPVRQAYLAELERFIRIYDLHPTQILSDAHPGYHSTALAGEWAQRLGLPKPVRVFHHHAHILSVMAEYGLTACLGIAMDGTGYGEDGTIWGGEVLIVNGTDCERAWHLPSMNIPGGDAAARDASLSAAGWLAARGEKVGEALRGRIPDDRLRILEAALRTGTGCVETTSAGRLFDAMSFILGFAEENRYEGECAMALEAAAHRALRGEGLSCDRQRERQALDFHEQTADAFADAALEAFRRTGERRVILSGGCFANRLLTSLLRSALEKRGMEVFVPSQIPSGDGGIAVGQAYYGLLRQRSGQ